MTLDLSAPICDWLPLQLYVSHRTGLPDVIMGRWPDVFGRTGTGRYKTWICESPKELSEVRKWLGQPVPIAPGGALDFRAGPDGALSRMAAGMMPRGEIVVALYPPPAEGWPWLILQSVPCHDPQVERGKYSWEVFESEAGALGHLLRMAHLGGQAGGSIHILRPEVRQ